LHLVERHIAVDLRVLREPQHAFTDDIALDLLGAALDAVHEGAERHHRDRAAARSSVAHEHPAGADDGEPEVAGATWTPLM